MTLEVVLDVSTSACHESEWGWWREGTREKRR
jgi:hypothetical protein